MKNHLKIFPIILILALILGALPLVVLAAENAPTSEVVANIFDGKAFTPADRATVTHSGMYNGVNVKYDYTKLTDNDMHLHTGRYSTSSSGSSQVFDGIIDLGGGYSLGELQIYDFGPSSTAAPFMGTALEIQVYCDGVWTTVVNCESNDDIIGHRVGSSYLSFDLSGVMAEKIRIYIPARLGTNSISIYEIKCSGVLESVADVFEGKIFEAGDRASAFFVGTHNGVNVNYDYTKLTDNNTHYQTGRFSTRAYDSSQVFDGIIDLGGGFFLDELKINDFNSTATTAPFMGTALEIQVYSLGTWTTVVSCASNDEIVQHRLDSTNISFDLGGVRAEKVRIYIPARLDTNSISINEIECSATIDHTVYDYFANLLLGKTFVPTEASAKEVHVDPEVDYGYAVITDDSYLAKGGRFSTRTSSSTQHVDGTVNLDGVYQLNELRIYDFNAHSEPNASNPGYLGTRLVIEAYIDGAWSTVVDCDRSEYGSHRVSPSAAWGTQYLAFDLTGVTAEMLRVYIPERADSNSISFYEITCSGIKIAEHTSHIGGDVVKENSTLPTCDKAGSYENAIYCVVCGIEMSRETVSVDALGHKYEKEVTAPTCTDSGYTTYTCTVCGANHKADETDALGHKYEKDVTDPTCTDGGYTIYTCTVCGESHKADETDALGHKYEKEVTAPTCTDSGYTIYTCTVCGESHKADETDALGHTEAEAVEENKHAPDCVNEGSYESVVYCKVCSIEMSRKTVSVDALGHEYEKEVTAPTCTDGGYTTYTCTVCGANHKADETDALGHTEAAAVIENENAASCTNNGSYDTVVYCSTCAFEISRETSIVDALGHKPGMVIETNKVDPDCENAGSYDKTVYCDLCGYVISTELVVIDALGHDFADATTEAPMTCKICGKTEGEKLPVTDPDTDTDKDEELIPEKNHGECEAKSIFEKIINVIINFIRSLMGLPEKCICGDEIK